MQAVVNGNLLQGTQQVGETAEERRLGKGNKLSFL